MNRPYGSPDLSVGGWLFIKVSGSNTTLTEMEASSMTTSMHDEVGARAAGAVLTAARTQPLRPPASLRRVRRVFAVGAAGVRMILQTELYDHVLISPIQGAIERQDGGKQHQ